VNDQALLLQDDDAVTTTPPMSSPAPLMVSAKRLGAEVRRNHSKRHRGRITSSPDKENDSDNDAPSAWVLSSHWQDDDEHVDDPVGRSSLSSTGSDGDDELRSFFIEKLSPSERNKHYWRWCYGTDAAPVLTQRSWSASRAPPTKSWYVATA
jgi:hypothetical protein